MNITEVGSEMDSATTVVFFAITWWLIFFITLPFGVRRLENPELGMEVGAPEKPRIWTKVAVTTLITGVVTTLLKLAMDNGIISLRDVVNS